MSFRAVAGAVLCALLVAAAEAAGPRILIVGPNEEPRFTDVARGLREGLAEQGRTPATFDVVETRVPRGERGLAETAIHDAARSKPDVAFIIGSVLAAIARERAPELPIVFITPGDPVAAGVVVSFRQPGRNMTALTFEYPELSAKRLEILRELAPRVRRVLVLYDPRDPSPAQGFAAARDAGAKLGVSIVAGELRGADAGSVIVERAAGVDGVLLVPGGAEPTAAADAIRAATARRLPVVGASAREAALGALAAYGASDVDVAREAARLVDKILRGARAGDLPVERPTKLRLVINRKTVKALGLTPSEAILLRADEVLE